MESRWENWVLDTTNFLNANDVVTYKGGWNANSLEGMNLPKGETLEISARLVIFQRTIDSRRALFARSRLQVDDLTVAHLKAKKERDAAEDELELLWGMLGDGIDMDALQQDDTLEALLRERRPHLFAEEEEENDDTDS
jgi:hypothetical protein